MTNKNTTKKALFTSILSLLICFTMLMGSTFAWFTDSVTSMNNIIQSGNLDVELWHCAPKDTQWGFGYNENGGKPVESDTELFLNAGGKPILWEPGAGAGETFRIVNAGSLALKYKFMIKMTDASQTPEGKDLTDVLKMQIVELENNANGVPVGVTGGVSVNDISLKDGYEIEGELLAGECVDYNVSIDWEPSDNDNDYNVNGGLSIDFGVTLVATQMTYEKDSYDDQYDKDAEYPAVAEIIKVEGNNKVALATALNDAKPGDIVKLSQDTTIAGYAATEKLVIEKPVVLDLDGKTLTTECGWGGIDLKGGVSIVNGTINHTGNTAAIKAFQVEKIENVTINVTETEGKTKGGIVVQQGSDCYVGSIKNVTINGATNGIECYRSTNTQAIGTMENVKINATDNGIYLNGAGNIGSISNCEIEGGNIGINAYLANLWHISLDIKNSTITGGISGIDIWDEAATNTGSAVTFNYDDATTFTGDTNDIKVTLQEEITCTINGEKQVAPCNIYIKK